jgi:uncharacterized glyoxalase superfamily protein PhnB
MSQDRPPAVFCPRIAYKNLRAAVDWLERAFGFSATFIATVPSGEVVHAEMRFGDGRIHIGSEWNEIKSPVSVEGANTQTLTVRIDGGLEEHFQRAWEAGGRILQEPTDQFHGDRTYRVADPEGHIWTFSQKLREVSVSELEAAVPGMKVWKAQ